MLPIEMRIHLRGRNIRMPQHLLHRAQVAAGLQQVRGEGMAQHMRMHMHAQAQLFGPMANA